MRATVLCLAALLIGGQSVRAQDTIPVRVIRQLGDSTFLVEIRGKMMLAVTETIARRALTADAEARAALLQLRSQDSLVAAYRRALGLSDTTVIRQQTLIAQLDSLYRGWRDVAHGWKSLSGEPWLTFDFGLGGTGSDHNPAVLAGLGIRQFRLWGFFQEANAGAALGMSLRLF